MGAEVLYNNAAEAVALTSVQFTNASGSVTDPSSVTAVVTDPTGAATSYTYTSGSGYNVITKVSAGNYSLAVDGLTVPGLYMYTWVGTGNGVQQVTPGTFRLIPLASVGYGMQYWYTGMEELKSRLGLLPGDKNYNAFNYEMQVAIHSVANSINRHCGRHFYQLSESRTYMPTSIWEVGIDDIAPATAAQTVVNVDYDGDGIYETAWGNPAPPVGSGSTYVLKLGSPGNYQDNYNPNAAGGVPRPYTQLQALMVPGSVASAGQWLPFVWPYTHLNRVEVTTVWGWDYVPPEVTQASLMLCTDIYKTKDTPWGMAGTAETGLTRIQSNPVIMQMLNPYVRSQRRWGV